MDFDVTDSMREIRERASAFANSMIAPRVAEYSHTGEYPWDLVEAMVKEGFMGGVIPSEYGGSNLSYLEYVTMMEELSAVDYIVAGVACLPSGLVGQTLLRFGTPEQKKSILPEVAAGNLFLGAALTEPSGGTDLASMQTLIRFEGDEMVLDGAKHCITTVGDRASKYLVWGQVDPSIGHQGLAVVIVDTDAEGFEIVPYDIMCYEPERVATLRFNSVRLPRDRMVGRVGDGFPAAMSAVDGGRLSVAARALGMMRHSIELVTARVRGRKAFGQDLGQFQLVQGRISDMVLAYETARMLVWRAAWMKDTGAEGTSRAASMAKMYAANRLEEVASSAITLFGADGLQRHGALSRYYREAKSFQIGEGTNDLHRSLLAEWQLGYRKVH